MSAFDSSMTSGAGRTMPQPEAGNPGAPDSCDLVIRVGPPTFEHVPGALGLGTGRPRISWRTAAPSGWIPVRYEMEITRGTGVEVHRVESSESVLVPWPSSPLRSRERASVRVRVGGADGNWSEWADSATAEAGLLDPLDWVATGISPGWTENHSDQLRRPPLLRREFEVSQPIARARLYVTAHGLYEVEINGRRVGSDALSPGWTVYHERLRYYTYDVTDHIAVGANSVGAWLGDGWYRGRLGFHGGRTNVYGTDLALMGQLEITHLDSQRDRRHHRFQLAIVSGTDHPQQPVRRRDVRCGARDPTVGPSPGSTTTPGTPCRWPSSPTELSWLPRAHPCGARWSSSPCTHQYARTGESSSISARTSRAGSP